MKKYNLILADPPWDKDGPDRRGNTKLSTVSGDSWFDNQMVLSSQDLCRATNSIPSADNCILLMWLPITRVQEAMMIIAAWRFTYKTQIAWVKMTNDGSGPRMGMGGLIRTCHELLFVATKGKIPILDRGIRSVIMTPLLGGHGTKPEEVYLIAERMIPGPYLELFARNKRKGWDSYGNQIDSKIHIPEWES